MSQTKIKTNLSELLPRAERGITTAGLATMIVAAVVGMTELADRQEVKILAPQPAYAFGFDGVEQNANFNNVNDSAIRKEREEVGHQEVSYGTTMRSHATTGKQ